jgi:surface protein
MTNMFYNASTFNQPINTWCVTQFTTSPNNFSSNCPLIAAYTPQWGSCPTVTPFVDTAICLGESAVIWAPTAPTYLVSPLHYTWSTGDTTLTLAATPQQTTAYVCTISDGIQSYSDTMQMVVDTIAQNFMAMDTVFSCMAQISIAAPAGFDSYSWSSGETTTSIHPHGTGWYTCTVTHGACTAADVVLYQDAGIRQNDTSICLQESITLSHSSFESIPKTSLLAFWPLHGNAIDMGQNNNGVIHGAQVTNGRFGEAGTALSFNGIDNYIQTPLQGSFPEITFSFWSFFDDSTLNMSSRNESVFGDWNNNNIHFGSRWSVGLHWNVNSAWTGITPSSLHYGWNHYVLVWNSLQNKKEVFINNVKVSTESANGNLQFGDFRIGVATNLNAYYRGKLSDFGVWSRALDTAEISHLYSGNLNTNNASPFTWNTNDTTSSITISPTQTTTYYCTVNNGISSCTDSVTVTVNPLPQNPIIPDSISVLASQVTITPQQGYAQYHWNTGDSSTTLTVNQSGIYSLTVINQNGCIGTDSVYVNIDPNFFEDSLGHIKCIYCVAGDTGTVNGILYEAVDRTLLNQRRDQGADLTKLCTTLVTDMSSLFSGNNTFNQDISHWDVSHVTTMQGMFSGANSFNQAIGTWDVGLVTDMRWMFYNDTSFNQAIGNWNVSSVTNMSGMFGFANNFNQPIGNWDVSHVTDMSWMFFNNLIWVRPMNFNQPIGNWDVGQVTSMEGMFQNATSFNQPIGNWNVSHVTNMSSMFSVAQSFNQPIGNWDVHNVTDMHWMFINANVFNQPIGNWDVSHVTNMTGMFSNCQFNNPIGNWDVSHVTIMNGMFGGDYIFNQPIGNWDVHNVLNMSDMFSNSGFNQPIGNWDVHNVVYMNGMFFNSIFNQPISNWDVHNVKYMNGMFVNCPFNQPIGNWDVSQVTTMAEMFRSATAFNQNISNWNVSHVEYVNLMFQYAINFNQPIGNWDVHNVKNMDYMFNEATSFNQPINTWCVYQIPTVPYQFAVNCPNPVSQQPNWGTCPSLPLTSTLFSTDSMRVCGAEVYLQAPTGYSYLWNNQDTTQGIHATQSGWYVCTITDNTSVSITDSIYIDLIHADIWVSNDTLLSCDSLQVAVALSTLNSNCTYAWNTGQNTANWQVSAMASQTLQVQVSNATHTCIDSTQITVLPRPLPLIAQDTLTACADSVLITAAAGYAHYQWNTGDTTQNIYAKYSGMYNLSVTHADGCMGTDTVLVSLIDDRIQQNDTAVCYGSNILVSVRGLFPSQHIAKTAEYVSNLYYDYDDFEGGLGSSDDWTERNGIDPQIVSNTAFSGSHSLYFNNGWGRNFEFGTAESAQPNGGYYSADYPYMSMAYKIPSTSHTTMLVHISGIGWRGIAFTQGEQLNCYPRIASWNATDTVITNNQWHFKTINLHEQLQQSLGAGNYKIEAVIFHDACSIYPVSGEMWIDQFMITKQRPSLYPVSYSWNTNDTTSSISVTPTQTTTYYCTVSNGISSCTDSVTVTVNPLPQNPIIPDSISVLASQVTITPQQGYAQYHWNTGDSSTTLTVNQSGMYSLTVINQNGCIGTDSVYVNIDPNFFEDSLGHIKCIYCVAGDTGTVNGILYEAVDRTLLNQRRDQGADLTKLCTTLVTDMSSLFSGNNTFNQDISHWDVSHVTNMTSMFGSASQFNQPIGNWDVSAVTNMAGMFGAAVHFNQPIGNWNTANVTNMETMFFSADDFNQNLNAWNTSNLLNTQWMFWNAHSFNQPIGNWDVSHVTNMNGMFWNAHEFNQPIANWNVSQVTNMAGMFGLTTHFNQPIGNWDVGQVTTMESMFSSSSFNQSLANWNVSNVLRTDGMFINSQFNQPINNWNVSQVQTMSNMFASSPFNQAIGNWDVHNVNYMIGMFNNTPFNQAIGNWDVHNVIDMNAMFAGSSFNQSIGNWDVGKVENMYAMFISNTSFNQPINNWNVGHVKNMNSMFQSASSFNQPIGSWNVSQVNNMEHMFENATSFNQPINTWCVYQIPTVPYQFSVNCPNPVSQQPHWGTCPSLPLTSTLFSTDSMRVCGEEVYLQAPTGYSYLWNNQDTTQGIHATQSGWYVCTITDNASVSITDSVYIDLIHADIWVSNDTLLSCDSLQVAIALSALNSNCTYAWNTGQNTANWQVSAIASQTLQVQVSNATHTCIDSTHITVLPRPLPLIAQDTITACADSVQVSASAGYSQYQWSTGDTTQSIFAKYTGMYTLSVTNANGCVGVDTVMISVIGINISTSDTTTCIGNQVTLQLDSIQSNTELSDAAQMPNNLLNGLIGYWPLSGNTNDISGNQHNAIAHGAVMSVDRKNIPGTCYYFNGIDAYMEVPHDSSLNFNQAYSVAFWVKNNNPYGGWYGCINKDNWNQNTGLVSFIVNANYTWVASGGSGNITMPLTTGAWTFICMVNSHDTAKLFANGVQVAQSIIPISNCNSSLLFGARHANDGTGKTNFLHGYLDDIGMWNRAISQEEVSQLYHFGNPTLAWSTGDTTSSINVTPTQTTTYYCTVSNGISSCTDSVTVTVNPLPQNPISQDTITACADSVMVTAASGYSHYQWNTGDTTQSIFAKYTGMYTLSVTNANGCVGVDSVLVSVIDAKIQQNDTAICFGSTLTLEANLLPSVLLDKIIGYWPLHGNGVDIVGNHNGVLNNFNTISASNHYLSFDGVNDYISVQVAKPKSSTFSAWARFNGINPDGRMLFNAGNDGSGPDLFTACGSMNWNTWDGCNNPLAPIPNNITDSNFHHIVVVNDSAIGTKLYYDGVQIGTTAAYRDASLTNILKIGGESGYFWQGDISDFSLYGKSLSSNEVFILYQTGQMNGFTSLSQVNQITWSTGDTTSTINVTPTQTTTYYCTVNNGISSCTDSVTITVNPLPTNFFIQDTLKVCNTSTTLSAPANGSYSWSNGATTQSITVNNSGWYACTYTNSNGCAGTDSMFVQFASPSSATNSATACNSYVWNTQTYTQSGTYTFTSLNAAGCTHTQTLVLTLNSSTSSNSSATAYNSYTWTTSAQTYTQSGIYTYTSLNAAGCTYTQSLALTIQQATVLYTINNLVQTANNQYAFDVWATNTGNTALNVRSLSFGLNCSPGLGTLSFTYLSGSKDALFNSISTYTASSTLKGSGANSYYHLRLSTGNATSGNEPLLAANTPVKIGRFRVSASGNFSNATNPFLPPSGISALQLLTASGYTQCVLNARINSSSTVYSLYGTGNAATGTALNSLSAQMQPSPNSSNPFLLYSCLPTGTSNSVTACGSYTWTANGQTYTQSGIYTRTSLNASGCTHTDTLQLNIQVCQTELHLGCLLEGYYDGNTGMMPVLQNQGEATTAGACDTIQVELHSDTAPYLMETSTHAVLQQNGTAICIFPIQTGSKYIVVKHRNAIETWSAQPINMGAVVNYDFRTAASQAYGSNQQDVSGNNSLYALYSGDINQDGNIDLYDLILVNDDIENFIYGYYATDITGDGNVDLYDLLILENNITNFIYAIQP